MELLPIVTDYELLSNVDMVIEVVPKSPQLIIEIFKYLESVCRPDCIMATNTSTLNINLIGSSCPQAHADRGAHGSARKEPEAVLLFINRLKATCRTVCTPTCRRLIDTRTLLFVCAQNASSGDFLFRACRTSNCA